MIIPFFIGALISLIWLPVYTNFTTKDDLTDNQIMEVCKALDFDSSPGETIHLKLFFGFLQAPMRLIVYVDNVKSDSGCQG